MQDSLDAAREAIDDDDIWHKLDIQIHSRQTDLGRLDGLLAGRPSLGIESLGPHAQLEIDRASWYALIESELSDPPTMAVLQAAMATLSQLARENDLLFAFDAETAQWWTPEVLSALHLAIPFVPDDHVRVAVEAVERKPGVGHLVRSRGLAKFARPDLAARVPKRDAPILAEILHDLVRLLAEGETISAGDRVRLRDLPALTMIPRSEDALSDAPADSATLYELRDLLDDGSAGPNLDRLLKSARPKPKLPILR